MIYLNKYESQRYYKNYFFWAFESKYFKVHKITSGPNKDKISFRFYNEENDTYNIKCSAILGCTRIIDTKYESNEKLRSIDIGGKKFRKVYYNSIESILKEFLIYNYTDEQIKKMGYYLDIRKLITIFGGIFSKIMNESKIIGDVIDKLKIIKKEITKKQYEHFKKWKFDNDTKKYNL